MATAEQIVDLADYSQERVGELVEDLETHRWPGKGDKCAACGKKTPCPTRHHAERTLFLIGYMRSTETRHELRELTDYVRWLYAEIERRKQTPTDHPQYAVVMDSLPMLHDRLAHSEERLLDAAGDAFPEPVDAFLEGMSALFARRREALESGEVVAPSGEGIEGHQTDTVSE